MSQRRPLTIFVPHSSELLTDHRPHGDGLVAHGFIRRLAERGHTLHVAVSKMDLGSPLPANAHLHPIRIKEGSAASRLRYSLRARDLFLQLSRSVTFDLVHQLNPVYTGVSLGMAGCDLPIVLGPYISDWPHNVSAISSRYGAIRFLLGQAKGALAALQQKHADVLLLTCDAATSRLVRQSSAKKVQMLPHGIDGELFCPGGEGEQPECRATGILFMATVDRRKGIHDLLHAFELVGTRYPQTRLTIAGNGPHFAEAQQIASSLSVSSKINFLGRLDRDGAARVLKQADIYCLPSHGEPYGMAAVEAMSCGKPVVVTNAGGLGCLVDDQGGRRVPVKNPEQLAAALCALVADPARCRAMGEHNRQRVLKTMTWERVIDRLEQIYHDSIESKQQGRGERLDTRPMGVAPGDACAYAQERL